MIRIPNRGLHRLLSTPGSRMEDKQWFAVYVRVRFEKKVLNHLVAKRIEAFLPTFRESKTWRNHRRVITEFPLFPGYIFAKIDLSDSLKILSTPGVVYFVGTRDVPTPMEESEILGLQAAVRSGNAVPHPFLRTGERVEITSGPLAGTIGILVQMRNSFRVVISIELIKRSVSVEVDRGSIARFGQKLDRMPA